MERRRTSGWPLIGCGDAHIGMGRESKKVWIVVRSAIARCKVSSVAAGDTCWDFGRERRRMESKSTARGSRYLRLVRQWVHDATAYI